MPNPKTVPSCPKPQVHNGWIRKSDLDEWLDRHLPVPTRVISNEEYLPIRQTARQCLLEQEIVANAERQARYLGMNRRQFLRTSCGMALAFAAMNSVFGHFFRVEAAELSESPAVAENKARFFIFDVQTHHVAMPNQAPRADQQLIFADTSILPSTLRDCALLITVTSGSLGWLSAGIPVRCLLRSKHE